MVRANIVKYAPKHSIVHIPGLMQIVQDYLQFEDAEKVYEYFRVCKPERPLFLCSEVASHFVKRGFVVPFGHKLDNITDWYIPYEDGYPLTSKILTLINSDSGGVFHLECPDCGEYKRLNYTKHGEGIRECYFLEVYALKMTDHESYDAMLKDGVSELFAESYKRLEVSTYLEEFSICDCQMAPLIDDVVVKTGVHGSLMDSALQSHYWEYYR